MLSFILLMGVRDVLSAENGDISFFIYPLTPMIFLVIGILEISKGSYLYKKYRFQTNNTLRTLKKEVKHYCTNCGKKLITGAKFCQNCGVNT